MCQAFTLHWVIERANIHCNRNTARIAVAFTRFLFYVPPCIHIIDQQTCQAVWQLKISIYVEIFLRLLELTTFIHGTNIIH